MKKNKGTPVKILFPNQNTYGAHINLRSFGIHKNTSHFNFSKLVLEYLTSEEAQDLITQGNEEFGGSFEYPVNPNVNPSKELSSWGNFREDQLPIIKIAELAPEAQKIIDRVGW